MGRSSISKDIKMIDTLFAGPWVGEFGWELFCWQGHLRYLRPNYKKIIVSCREGHEVIYEDFADEILSVNISCEETDMWNCRNYKAPTFQEVFKRRLLKNEKWIPPNIPIVRYDHRHILDEKPLFKNFKNQKYFKYGDKSKNYDIVWHARETDKSKTGYRNWPLAKWNELASFYKDKKTATIGTQNSSFMVGGEDLRGISLKKLANVLSSSTLIVGPSSGPIHFASLCGCNQISWYGDPYNDQNKIRFEKDWNPFGTKVKIIRKDNWDVNVSHIRSLIDSILQ